MFKIMEAPDIAQVTVDDTDPTLIATIPEGKTRMIQIMNNDGTNFIVWSGSVAVSLTTGKKLWAKTETDMLPISAPNGGGDVSIYGLADTADVVVSVMTASI